MSHSPEQLRGTLRICAAERRAVLVADYRRAAFRAKLRHFERHGIRRALALVDLKHFRDYLPRLLENDGVPYPQVEPVDIVLIMQRRGGNGRPREAYRLYNDLRCQNTGAPDLHDNVEHPALLPFWRVLERHRPAGSLCRAAQRLALREGIYLDDRAVHIIRQRVAVFAKPLYLLHAVLNIAEVRIRYDREAHFAHRVQRLGVILVRGAGGILEVEAQDIQLSRRRDLRVKLAHRACGGVARVCEKRLALYFALGVQLLKHGLGHIDLAADDEPLRRVLNMQRQGAHSAQILRHIFADLPVAAGSSTDEHAVFVFKRHGKPVDFRLDGVIVRLRYHLVHALAECEQLLV